MNPQLDTRTMGAAFDARTQEHPLSRVCMDPGLMKFLESAETEAIRVLAEATDPVAIHRSQGQLLFVRGMLKDMRKAKDLR